MCLVAGHSPRSHRVHTSWGSTSLYRPWDFVFTPPRDSGTLHDLHQVSSWGSLNVSYLLSETSSIFASLLMWRDRRFTAARLSLRLFSQRLWRIRMHDGTETRFFHIRIYDSSSTSPSPNLSSRGQWTPARLSVAFRARQAAKQFTGGECRGKPAEEHVVKERCYGRERPRYGSVRMEIVLDNSKAAFNCTETESIRWHRASQR